MTPTRASTFLAGFLSAFVLGGIATADATPRIKRLHGSFCQPDEYAEDATFFGAGPNGAELSNWEEFFPAPYAICPFYTDEHLALTSIVYVAVTLTATSSGSCEDSTISFCTISDDDDTHTCSSAPASTSTHCNATYTFTFSGTDISKWAMGTNSFYPYIEVYAPSETTTINGYQAYN